jgi:Zn finger protein HypA/HybF involved in hydrogenase expression
MSEPSDQSTLPPDFGNLPHGSDAPAVPQRRAEPESTPPLPASPEPAAFSDEHRLPHTAARAGWTDLPGDALPPPLPPGLASDAPPTTPPVAFNCTSCGSRFVTNTQDPICPACRKLIGGLPSSAATAPFEVRDLKCVTCGYDLTGLRSDAGCSECGTPLSRSLPAWTIAVAQPFAVSGYLCLNCGYDLTGLSSAGACPECGIPVERSLKGNLLRFASVEYVTTLRTGILLAEIATVAGFSLMFLAIGVHFIVGSGAISMVGASLINAGLSIIASGLAFLGWWLFSTPDPARIGKDEAIGARKLLRIALPLEFVLSIAKLGSVLLPAGMTAFAFGAGGVGTGPGWAMAVVLLSSIAGTGAFMFRFFSSMLYLRSVARRFPDAKLYRLATHFMWLGPVLVVSTIVTCGLGYLAAHVVYLIILERTRSLMHATLNTMQPVPAKT